MGSEGGIKCDGALPGHRHSGAIVDGGRSHQADSTVSVFVVVPLEEPPAVNASVLDRAEALREVGSVFQSFELRLGVRIVIRDMRAAVGPGDIEIDEQLIADTVEKEDIAPGTLTLHADRGTSMRSKAVAALLIDLDVAKTHSRPHVSDDNPYSEAQFKTLKYRPDFPQHFGSIEDPRAHCQRFFQWYNHEHRHGGIGLMAHQADSTVAVFV